MSQEQKTNTILGKDTENITLKFNDLSLNLSLLNVVDIWVLTDELLNIQNYHSNFNVSISKNQSLISFINKQHQNQFLVSFENFRKHNNFTDVSVSFANSKNTFKINCTNLSEERTENLFLFIFRDQTQIFDFSEKLNEANKKIEEISHNREIFIANMSHLVRTPLNAIFGMTELLYGSDLNVDQIENIEVIENSAENLLTVISDIIDIKKIEAEKIVFEKKGVVLYEKMLALYNILKAEADRKKLNFEFNFPENKKLTVILTDPARLNQLILNILNNAVKYTNNGSVNLKIEILNETDENIDISFSISDTGIGIPEKNLDYIFFGFTRPGTQTIKKISGNGLGLFICKQLVDLMKGEIKVDSAEGRGSTFTVNLSFLKGNESDLSTRKHTSIKNKYEKLENVNILLVEDQEFNQLLVEKITAQWSCKLDIANNGEEALVMLKSNKYDVVLMDIQLPLMSGLQATQIIRTKFEEPLRSIPIIALTANAIDGDYELYINSGMNDYIPKPFRSQELYEIITKNLKKNTETKLTMKTIENQTANANASDKFSLKKILEIAKGDKSYVREMILVFIDQCLEIKEYLIEALANKDTKELGDNAHKLKSSASIMCLTSIENEIIEIVEISREKKHNDKIFNLAEYVVNELEMIIPGLQIELKTWPK